MRAFSIFGIRLNVFTADQKSRSFPLQQLRRLWELVSDCREKHPNLE